jgi:CHAT domain-containing protein
LEKLQRVESGFMEEIKDKYPRYYRLVHPEILKLTDIQHKVLRKGQVLIEYLVGNEKTFIWIMNRKEFAFKTIRLPGKELAAIMTRISPIFVNEKTGRDIVVDHRWANFNPDMQSRLFDLILKTPAGDFLETNAELIIVPDGILHYLPFELLVTGYKDGRPKYLIEKFPVAYSSSASVLAPQLRKSGRAGKSLLAFGNPSHTNMNKGILEWVSDLDPLKLILRGEKFEPLPNSEFEVKSISCNFENSNVYIGENATESRFKESAGDYRFIHLAAHYLSSNDQPMYSKIVMAKSEKDDGLLQTYEIYNLRLNADLVVLSGCNTGLGKLSRGEGLIGMSRAFLHAGVPSVVVSLWPVEDASTAEFMNNFYICLKKGMSKSRALQQAKIKMLESADIKQDPFYWSPFVLIGDTKETRIK